jgi:hypothetical protein
MDRFNSRRRRDATRLPTSTELPTATHDPAVGQAPQSKRDLGSPPAFGGGVTATSVAGDQLKPSAAAVATCAPARSPAATQTVARNTVSGMWRRRAFLRVADRNDKASPVRVFGRSGQRRAAAATIFRRSPGFPLEVRLLAGRESAKALSAPVGPTTARVHPRTSRRSFVVESPMGDLVDRFGV